MFVGTTSDHVLASSVFLELLSSTQLVALAQPCTVTQTSRNTQHDRWVRVVDVLAEGG
jgi:hypothetical protein